VTILGEAESDSDSKRLVEEVLGCGEDGVTRVSLVHYNTGMSFQNFYLEGRLTTACAEEEVEKFVKVLDETFPPL